MRGKNDTAIYDQLPAIAEQILRDYCDGEYTKHDVECLTRTLEEICDTAISESQMQCGEAIDLEWASDYLSKIISTKS